MHNYSYKLAKQIVSVYVCIRLIYHTKLENEAIKKVKQINFAKRTNKLFFRN